MSVITQFHAVHHLTAVLPAREPLFHKTGLVYFWFHNDACEPELAVTLSSLGLTSKVCVNL